MLSLARQDSILSVRQIFNLTPKNKTPGYHPGAPTAWKAVLQLDHKLIVRFDALDKRREHLDDLLHILEVRHFHDGMHVTQGQGNQPAGDAVLHPENFIRVRAAVS